MGGGIGGGFGDILSVGLPIAGTAVGATFGGPAGAAIGGGLGTALAGGIVGGQEEAGARGAQQSFLKGIVGGRRRSGLGRRLKGLVTGGPTPQELAQSIVGQRRRGAVAAGTAQRRSLESALGRAGASGGLRAAVEAGQAGGQIQRLADIEASGVGLEQQFRGQQAGQLGQALQLLFPSPGAGVPGLAQSLGQTSGFGQALTGFGTTLGTLGLASGLGLFGQGGTPELGVQAGQRETLGLEGFTGPLEGSFPQSSDPFVFGAQ